MARPFVSVLIDTYNHEKFIEKAIASALEQDFPTGEREIIVVDDGSTDRTPEIIRKFEPHVRLLRKANGGQASAFNAGIPECRGEIVAFLDGDDWWTREKLRRVAEELERNPDAGFVGHGYFQTNPGGTIQTRVVPETTLRLSARSVERAREFDRLKGFFGTSKVTYRRALLERILPVPEELVIEADEFLWTLGICLADAILLAESLFCYRFHASNLFMLQGADERGLRKKHQVLSGLLRELPPRLAALGVTGEISRALLESLSLDAEFLRLALHGGTRREMFHAEREADRIAHKNSSVGYKVFKSAVLALTLVMPPQWFLRVKKFYSDNGLAHLRSKFGGAARAAPIVEQRWEA